MTTRIISDKIPEILASKQMIDSLAPVYSLQPSPAFGKQHWNTSADNIYTMSNIFLRIRFNLVLAVTAISLLGLTCCGGAQTGSETEQNPEPSASVLDTNLTFSFNLTLELDASDSNYDMTVVFPDTYSFPIKLDSDGTVSVMANSVDRMVYRLCSEDSSRIDCDFRTDALGAGEYAADLVIDSCGRLVSDSSCGENDSTIFTGEIDTSGNMSIGSVSIRIRLFLVTSTSDGFLADDSDEGLMPINRLLATLTTDDVSSGAMSASGTPIHSKSATLVASGTVSSTAAAIGGANFVATLSGSFDTAPLTLFGD